MVITGGAAEVKRQSALLESQGFKVVALSVANAYHSPHMQGASDYFMKLLSTAQVEAPRKAKVFSNVTAEAYPVNQSSVREILSRHITSSVRFVEQIENMYAQGARVFVEFGPRNTLTKLTEQILKHHNDPDVRTIAVNSTSKQCSDVLLRKAAIELCVAGVALADFDPWAVDDPFVMDMKKKRKTMLRLSAATYVSKGTKKKREAFLNDGFRLSGKVVAASAGTSQRNNAADAKKIRELEQELIRSRAKMQDVEAKAKHAQQMLDEARGEIQGLKEKVSDARSARVVAPAPVSTAMTTYNGNASQSDLMAQFYESGLLASLLQQHQSGGSMSIVPAQQQQQQRKAAPAATYSAPAAAAPAASSAPMGGDATKVVMEVLASKTGYDVDMIEDDMELETELGIDSIKRVEILSEVQSRLGVEAKDVAALSRTRTVGEVISAMAKEMGGAAPAAPAAYAAPTPGGGCSGCLVRP